jgi:Flp pilus assembly protein TadB
MLDAVAAGVRAGHSLRMAVERSAPHWPGGIALPINALRGAFNDDDYRLVVRAIDGARSMVGSPSAVLQAAASAIRERRAAAANAATHSTQAMASATLLTLLPIAVFLIGTVASRSFRHTVATPQGFTVSVGGLILNVLGWLVIRRTVAAAARLSGPTAAFNDAAELVVIALRAGELPAAAIEWVALGGDPLARPAFTAVTEAQRRGRRFADSLPLLVETFGPVAVPFTEAVVAAELDGLPLAPVIERVSADVRAERVRLHDIAVRRLPVRLTLPLVACTLPAFALLTIAPMVIAAVRGLHY